MKKFITTILLIIIIPYLVVTIFVEDKNIKFEFATNTFVRVLDESSGNILKVPLEEYVKGVVAGEMPASFNIEALKAQAVASRSYVLKHMQQSINNPYDVVDTIKNQVYLTEEELKTRWKDEYDIYINKIEQAVISTKGEYISYEGDVIEAFFFSTSNGKTENSGEVFLTQLPYLKSVDSTWDKASPAFTGSKEVSLADFYTKLNLKYNENLNIKILSYTASGAIKKLSINGTQFEAYTIRDKFGLRSTSFTINKVGSNVVFTTKGYGHGVGMSQYGAQGMANNGYKYEEIIKHYYQGVEISKI